MQHLKRNQKYKILTNHGFKSFSGIVKSKKEAIKITFDDNTHFICTKNHRLLVDGIFVQSQFLELDDIIENKKIIKIEDVGEQFVYDPVEVQDTSSYISDGMISHNCSFLGSSLTLLTSSTLASLSVNSPVKHTDNLKVYAYPETNNKYVLVCDPSEGVGIDSSAFCVIDITDLPYKVVATYRNNKISPNILPNIIHRVATSYNQAYVMCEINKVEMVANILHNDLEYENLLYVVMGKSGQEISAGFGGSKPRFGVITDKRVKRLGCSTLKQLVENNKLIFSDDEIISEFSTFIERKGSYGADDGYHDDLVMTLVLFSWMTTCNYFKELNDNSRRENIFKEMINRAEEELTPFGFILDGTEEETKLVNF